MNNLVENKEMPIIDNFLQQGVSHTRQSVIDIDESYNNEWDILAELLQNSVDAIRESDREDGNIILNVNCQNKIISVKDNGIGIDTSHIQSLLALFGTNKKGKEKTIGEKGVGLKFAMFSCNDFLLKTATEDNASEAIVKDAYNWKKSTEDKYLSLEINELENSFDGTEIILKEIQESPIFDLTLPQLRYVLRTRTAIGNTNAIFDTPDKNITVILNYTTPTGSVKTENIPFKYLLPIENVGANDKISMEEYYAYTREGNKDDQQKRLKLKNRIVYTTKKIEVKNKDVWAFACLVPRRITWGTVNNYMNLATEEDLKNDSFLQNFSYATLQPGIFTSVKGMPTGIRIEPPITGSAGTWGSIFILFDDRKLTFDIGRKSIHGRVQKVYQEYAREIFNDFRTNVIKYTSGDITPESTQWDRDEVFEEVESLIDLNNKNTNFVKTPKDQEATVAALFFECIGSGKINKLKPLIAGYKNKYDLYARWEKKRIVVEFKSHLYKIIKDFNDEVKMFNEVDCIACWDVSEEDEQAFKDISVSLDKVNEPSVLNKSNDTFPYATHVLRYSNFSKPIYVIDMKILLAT